MDLQVLLRQILLKLGGLESSVARQDATLKAVQDSLLAVQGDVKGVKQEVKTNQARVEDKLQDVVLFAREKGARVSEQAKKQRLFMDALYVVANVGYDKEVRAVFSLNRDTWTDFRLWSVIINDKIKHTEWVFNDSDDEEEELAFEETQLKETRLIHQVRVGRESSVLRLLHLGANLHLTDLRGKTALSHASAAGRNGLVKALLAAGSKVDHADEDGFTSLMDASTHGYDECVELLIEAKANVDHACDDERTSLMQASRLAYPMCVKLLLAAKANVNHTDVWGDSALIDACANSSSVRREEVIEMLIEAKADVNSANAKYQTALMCACKHYNYTAVKLLINEAKTDLNRADKEGRTVLMQSCLRGDKTIVELLLLQGEEKLDLDRADKNGNTALMLARHDPYVAELLIEAKADVNRADFEGYTALMSSCKVGFEGCPATAKLLLAVPGIDVIRVGKYGETALSIAQAPPKLWEGQEEYQRRLSLVPFLEEKMRQQAIDLSSISSGSSRSNNNKNNGKGMTVKWG